MAGDREPLQCYLVEQFITGLLRRFGAVQQTRRPLHPCDNF
jgi:hypothetical protein